MIVTVHVIDSDTLLNQNLLKVKTVLLNSIMKRVTVENIPLQAIDSPLAQLVVDPFQDFELSAR